MVVFGGGFLAMLTLRTLATIRDRRVHQNDPDTVVMSAGTSTELRKVLSSEHTIQGGVGLPSRLPLYFTVTADTAGIGFWKNSREPIVVFPWATVVSMVPSLIQERARTSRSVSLTLTSGTGQVMLPLGNVGAGFLGMFPHSTTWLDQLCAQWETLQRAAARH